MITKTPFLCTGCKTLIFNNPSFSKGGEEYTVTHGKTTMKVTSAEVKLCALCDPNLYTKLMKGLAQPYDEKT